MDKTEKTLKENLIFKGRILTLYDDDVECPNGHHAKREYIHHNGGVCILPYHNGLIYFVRQFRYPYHKELLELPAGKIDGDENKDHAIKRELKEEVGLIDNNIEYIGYFYPSVGYTDEVLYLYFSENSIEGEISPDEDEFLDIVKLTPLEAYDLLDKGEIVDGKTIILLEKLRNRLLK